MRLPLAITFLLVSSCLAGTPAGTPANSSSPRNQDLLIWTEFVDLLKAAPFPGNRIEPYSEDLRGPIIGFLDTMRVYANWSEWRREPEVFRSGNRVHFLTSLSFAGDTATYCFTFIMRNDNWYFQHLETITLRMDQLGALPSGQFPDISERQKAWIRNEFEVSRDVNLFNMLVQDKSRQAALDWFKDGAGYALAAKVWVPMTSPDRAFILYLCWEQANLRGNRVILEQLDDSSAVIRMKPLYFELYASAAHLKQQINADDYRLLFESRWQDRAANAGWKLDISYEADECIFRFSK